MEKSFQFGRYGAVGESDGTLLIAVRGRVGGQKVTKLREGLTGTGTYGLEVPCV